MIGRGIDMSYVHNSALLLSILDGVGGNVPHTVHRAARLTTVCREYTRFKRRAGCNPNESTGTPAGGDAQLVERLAASVRFALKQRIGGLKVGRGTVLMAKAWISAYSSYGQ